LVVSVFLTGCINMLGMIVDAARVEGANTEGGYALKIDWLSPVPNEEVEGEGEWWAKGRLGLRSVGVRSNPKEELRREAASKFPDLFPRRVAVSVNPVSVLPALLPVWGG